MQKISGFIKKMLCLDKWQKQYWITQTRFYQVELKQDIFSNWIIERGWGSLTKKGSRTILYVANDYSEAYKLLQRTAQRCIGKGYEII